MSSITSHPKLTELTRPNFQIADIHPSAEESVKPVALLAAHLCICWLLRRLCSANSVLDKTLAGVAVIIDAVLLLQLLDVV